MTLELLVTYDGDPYANAEVFVNRRNTFTNATYEKMTDGNGKVTLVFPTNGIGNEELRIIVKKDINNSVEMSIQTIVGVFWIVILVIALVAVILSLYFLRRKSKNSN